MLFSSLTFLTLFLPIVILLYFVSNNIKYQNFILLITSLIFYAWGEPKYLLVMIMLLLLDYVLAILIDEFKKYKKIILIFCVMSNLIVLFYFKYFDFFIHNINVIFKANLELPRIALPIGISFYLFQVLTYVVDVYTGKVKVQKNVMTLFTYVTLFPQLIAGPIVRYSTVEAELVKREVNWKKFYEGLRRFIIGLGKKVIIANNVAMVADRVFSRTPTTDLNFTLAWIGVISFTLQIYFDFSGYSDMAIGLGQIFGFQFLENFNYPYISKTITDFWRRWHISLSSVFRDYVYIPLGGNRVSMIKWLRNIFIVWGLTGLWHGANWNFILWGLYFGTILVIEKLFLNKYLQKSPNFIQHIYAILFIVIGWVIFNSNSISQIAIMLYNMFVKVEMINFSYIKNLRILYLWPYYLLAIIGCTEVPKNLINKIDSYKYGNIIVDIYLIFILYWSIVLLINNSYNPFIYFRF